MLCQKGEMRMKIGFIGAGKVGYSLGKYLTEREEEVVGYYSKNKESAKKAAEFTKTKAYERPDELVEESDIVFITVPDNHIKEVAEQTVKRCESKGIEIEGKIFSHCSGALTSEIFSDITTKVSSYSIHPLLAVDDKLQSYKEFSDIIFTIEGDRKRLPEIRRFLEKLGNEVVVIEKEEKPRYHAAAAMGSNLVLALFDTVIEEMHRAGFEREEAKKAIVPFMCKNIAHLEEKKTEEALTGPVARGDYETVRKHMEVLESENREIYRLLSRKAMKIAERKCQKNKEEMEALLNEEYSDNT